MYLQNLIEEIIFSTIISIFVLGIIFIGENSIFLNADKSINYSLLAIMFAVFFLIIFVLLHYISGGKIGEFPNDPWLP